MHFSETGSGRSGSVEYVIEYRGAHVSARFDSLEVARAVKRQFLAYGARLAEAPADVPTVTVGQLDASCTQPGWRHINVHGGGHALVPNGELLVTGPPMSITSVTRPDISLLHSGDVPDLPFVHHLVKYPLRDQMERRGGFLAHSAAIEVDAGSCALFLGQSGAGKSTMFLEMVTAGFGALGNDSTLLEAAPEGVLAAAWPHIVRIGQGTAAHNAVLGSLPDTWAPRSRVDGKFEVFFDRLDEVFGRSIVGRPTAVAVVFDLAIDTTGTDYSCVRLPDGEAKEFIERSLVVERLPTGWLPSWTWEPDFDAIRAVGELLLARVPMYRLEIGVADPGWPRRLADRLREIVR